VPILTIETSTPIEDVAVVEGGRILAEERRTAGRGHAEELLAAVAFVLDRTGLVPGDLDAVAVSIGPGRFSGLRVGLATAKGLALESGLPVVPVPTLPALARSGGVETGLVCPVIDARRGEVYGALFREGTERERILPDAALPPAILAEQVKEIAPGEFVLFLGTGASVYEEEISGVLGAYASFASPAVEAPVPLAIAGIAAELRREPAPDLGALEPIYLRGVL
jgi:tRNA threonylcarbamoyladenosine biosynthesis protein TsaB